MTPSCWPSGYQNNSLLFDFGLNMAGMSSLSFDPSALRHATTTTNLEAGSAVYVRMEHTEIVDTQQHAYNNYYPSIITPLHLQHEELSQAVLQRR